MSDEKSSNDKNIEKTLKDIAMRNGIIENYTDIIKNVDEMRKDLLGSLSFVKNISDALTAILGKMTHLEARFDVIEKGYNGLKNEYGKLRDDLNNEYHEMEEKFSETEDVCRDIEAKFDMNVLDGKFKEINDKIATLNDKTQAIEKLDKIRKKKQKKKNVIKISN